MKIAVKVTVEMTPEQARAYAELAGLQQAEIRSDVRDYIRTALQDAPYFTDGQADVMVAD